MSDLLNTLLSIVLIFHILGEVVAVLIVLVILTLFGIAWLAVRPAKSRPIT